MCKIRILPKRETMLFVYPIVASHYVKMNPGIPLPLLILILLSSIGAIGWSAWVLVRKARELQQLVEKRKGE